MSPQLASPINTQCPHCGHGYAVTAEQAAAMAGRSFACTSCGQAFTLSPGGAAFAQQPGAADQQSIGYASGAYVKSNPLAIISLVSGCLLCLPVVPGIVSIITGALGMRKARDPAVVGKGMAIAGLVLGIVNLLAWGAYIAFVAVMVTSVTAPALARARGAANQVKCASNLRQLGQAIRLYAAENGGAYPDTIERLVADGQISADVYVCPDSSDTPASGADATAIIADMAGGGHVSYVYAGKALITETAQPKAVVAYEPVSHHDGAGSNMLFADGTAEFIASPRAQRMIEQIEAGRNPPEASAGAATAPAGVER